MKTSPGYSNSGHRKRLRDRFLYGGGRALHNYEKLEMLLTYCIPRRDVKPLAKKLLCHFGSLQSIMNASADELCEVDGIGENCAALILLVKELCSDYLEEKMFGKITISDLTAAIEFARMKIGGCPRETYMLIFLDARNQILEYECFTEGTLDRTAIYSREVITMALKYKACAVIIIHNHPTGVCMPSAEDMNSTVRIAKALASINVILYDHVIVSAFDHHSMAANKELPVIK